MEFCWLKVEILIYEKEKGIFGLNNFVHHLTITGESHQVLKVLILCHWYLFRFCHLSEISA